MTTKVKYELIKRDSNGQNSEGDIKYWALRNESCIASAVLLMFYRNVNSPFDLTRRNLDTLHCTVSEIDLSEMSAQCRHRRGGAIKVI